MEGLEHYLDDFILVLPLAQTTTPDHIRILDRDYNEMTDYLGLLRNPKKDVHGPIVEVLGIEIDTLSMQARLSQRKITKATSLVSSALAAGSLTLLDTQKITGFLSFCSSVVTFDRLHLRNLWHFTASFKNGRKRRPLNEAALYDLRWWNDMLPTFNGIYLFDETSRNSVHLFTDASSYGVGGFWYPAGPAQGAWRSHTCDIPQSSAFSYSLSPEHRALHINSLEIWAI